MKLHKSRVLLLFLMISFTLISLKFLQSKNANSLQHRVLALKARRGTKSLEGVNNSTVIFEAIFDVFNIGKLSLSHDELHESIAYQDRSNLKGSNTKHNLNARAIINETFEQMLTEKHQIIRDKIDYIGSYTPYTPDSYGVTIVGGGKFTWLAYLSIMQLRKIGSNLPVEVLIPTTEEYFKDKEFCEITLPKLGGECIVLADILGKGIMDYWADKIGGYQYKSLSMLVSKFQNVLLLDADNFVVQNPEEVFKSDIYKQHGMIAWPDYWARSIHPHYYNISNIKVDESKRARYSRFDLFEEFDRSQERNAESEDEIDDLMDYFFQVQDYKAHHPEFDAHDLEPYSLEEDDDVPFHDLEGAVPDLSTESGQLFMNKGDHTCTLLLSVYYNLFGPGLYYKLFSLGELGEGDKDTFPAAAYACQEKLYQVKSFITTMGYFDDNGFHGVGMGQKNPLVDATEVEETVTKPIKDQKLTLRQQMKLIDNRKDNHFDKPAQDLFSVHCNFPKYDLVDLMLKDLYDLEANKLSSKILSGFKYKDPVSGQKVNLELSQWQTINHALCVENLHFDRLRDFSRDFLCEFTMNQIVYLSNDD